MLYHYDSHEAVTRNTDTGCVCCWSFAERNFQIHSFHLIVHGAKVSCKVVDVHHRRSPLVQGGLEIFCKLTVKEKMTDTNSDKYKQLVSDQYQGPVEEMFPYATQEILEAMSDEELDYS